jgi:hypothetical protein
MELMFFSDDDGLVEMTLEYQSEDGGRFDVARDAILDALNKGHPEGLSDVLQDTPMCDVAGVLLAGLIHENWPVVIDMTVRAMGLDPADFTTHAVEGDGSARPGGGISWN